MTKTRHDISIRGLTYQRVKDYADAKGESVSGLLEEWIGEKLDTVAPETKDDDDDTAH